MRNLLLFLLVSFGTLSFTKFPGAVFGNGTNSIEWIGDSYLTQEQTPDLLTQPEIENPTVEKNLAPQNPRNHTTYIILLIILSIVSMIFLFILLLYIKSRERIYLYYFLFLGCCLVNLIIDFSRIDWMDFSVHKITGFENKTKEAFTLLALFFYCLFTLQLLNVKNQAPKLARWINVIAGVAAFYGILYWIFFPLIASRVMEMFITSRLILLPMAFVAIIWVSYRIQSVFKGYFIIGSVFYFVGALLGLLRYSVKGIPIDFFYNIAASVYYHMGIFLEIICFALALSHRIYLLYKEKQERDEQLRQVAVYERDVAISQVLASQTQSNRHFIFNILNAIKYLIQSNQNKLAIKALTDYSRFIRSILDAGMKSQITLTEELGIVSNYLSLEAMRLQDGFSYSIEVSPEVETDGIAVPPLLFQQIVERIIWKENNRTLNIFVNKYQKNTVISISKNEITDFSAKIDEIINSKGQLINNERIDLYNKIHKNQIQCYNSTENDRKGNMILNASVIIITTEENNS